MPSLLLPDRRIMAIRRRLLAPSPGLPVPGARQHLFSGFTPGGFLWVSPNGNNSNPGTEGSPKLTIGNAIAAASAGTQINIKGGTYNEHVNAGGKHGGANAPIILKSIDGDGAAHLTPPTSGNDTLKMVGCENWLVEGLKITGPLSSSWNAVKATQDGSSFSDMARRLVYRRCEVFSPSGAGDGFKMGSGCEQIQIHYNTIYGAGGNGPEQGIDFVAVNDSEIFGNEIYQIGGSALIQVKGGSTNVLIEQNVCRNSTSSSVDGIRIGGAVSPIGLFRPGYDTCEAKNVIARDNQVFDIGKRGVWFMGAQDCILEFNNIFNCGGRDVDLLQATGAVPANCLNITIRNNIFDNTNWLIAESGQSGGLSVSGNFPNDDS